LKVQVLVRDLDFWEGRSDAVPSTQIAQCDTVDPLVGRHVVIIQGPCKDYRGIIKDVNHFRGVAIVELEATVRKSMFKFQDLTIFE
jgi:transcription antitermination factor NusG